MSRQSSKRYQCKRCRKWFNDMDILECNFKDSPACKGTLCTTCFLKHFQAMHEFKIKKAIKK